MQKHVNLVDLVKSFPTNIFLQNLASIQKRTSPVKFAHLAEKSGKGSISNLSTKLLAAEVLVPVQVVHMQRVEGVVDLGRPTPRDTGPHGPILCQMFMSKFRQHFPRFRLYRHRPLQVNTSTRLKTL